MMRTRLIIIAVVPAIISLLAIYLTDRVDKEPAKLLFLTFILGAFIVIPTIVVEEILVRFNIFPGIYGALFNAYIVAGLTEEYFKRLVVLKLPFKTNYFNEKLDGIIYGVFAALGFATVENIMYVAFRYTNNPFIGLYRGIFSVPAHGVFGITMGYYLSLSKFHSDKDWKIKNKKMSLIMPVILHGTFDFILMANIPSLSLFFVPYVLFLWWLNERRLEAFMFDSKTSLLKNKDLK
ncbi:PrsW family intramembrane metalloprotease [Tissierella creatinophila]|uniref:Protease PrsW n=1 Tax=Tissierella creatinophila DSM 6911 TaxID=1123403 RepID=A0A1U7M440_TISCR|nr:PrsW family glutamic-type intramembrane protease [Tissierella creatinophila]OLS02084.1 protease PrsW [Tissierella creatinophila DSM 6911]